MPTIMAKPDALTGPTSVVTRSKAQDLLLGLARHCEPGITLPKAVPEAANQAARQIAERAATEHSFAGRIYRGRECSQRLLEQIERLPEADVPTTTILRWSLQGLGFNITNQAEHVLTKQDVDAIYAELTAEDYRSIRPQLISYLVGYQVQVFWLDGDQHPAALQHWKIYVRRLLLERPPGGGYLLRNLVHVCEGPDADYLTRRLL